MQLCAPRVTVLPAHIFMNCSAVVGGPFVGTAGTMGAARDADAEGDGGFALGFVTLADAQPSRRSRYLVQSFSLSV